MQLCVISVMVKLISQRDDARRQRAAGSSKHQTSLRSSAEFSSRIFPKILSLNGVSQHEVNQLCFISRIFHCQFIAVESASSSSKCNSSVCVRLSKRQLSFIKLCVLANDDRMRTSVEKSFLLRCVVHFFATFSPAAFVHFIIRIS